MAAHWRRLTSRSAYWRPVQIIARRPRPRKPAIFRTQLPLLGLEAGQIVLLTLPVPDDDSIARLPPQFKTNIDSDADCTYNERRG